MKKGLIFLLAGLLLVGIAGTALAATSKDIPVPVPDTTEQYSYQQMYEACHGPNGYMTKYFGNGNQQQS